MSNSFKIPAKKTINIEHEGTVYEVRRPTLDEQDQYQEAWSNAKSNKDRKDILYNHIQKLGLPISVITSLDDEQFEFVTDAILSVKKN